LVERSSLESFDKLRTSGIILKIAEKKSVHADSLDGLGLKAVEAACGEVSRTVEAFWSIFQRAVSTIKERL
jgi:hypothetical protein